MAQEEAAWSQGSTVNALKLITLLACTGLLYNISPPCAFFWAEA